jgi:magnesium transporter
MGPLATVTLLGSDGTVTDPSWDEVRARFDAGTTLWLDLSNPSDEAIDEMAELFGFHRLAVEDTHTFSQRAKLVVYEDHAFVVAFAASTDDRIEVHCYYRPGVVVTVHRQPCPPVEGWFDEQFDHEFDAPGLFLLYRLLDSLASSFPPVLDTIDEGLVELEDAILSDPDPAQMAQLTTVKRQLTHLRRAVIPGRDTLGGGTSLAIEELPGITDEARRYFRDLYDHLVHVAEQVDSEREHAASVMDVYLTTVNNRQNDVMKQLTAVSTIFLPLMFVTGFFGMNFAWMVRHVEGPIDFLVLGLGLQVVSVVALLALLKRRGWF